MTGTPASYALVRVVHRTPRARVELDPNTNVVVIAVAANVALADAALRHEPRKPD
jgi:hypothetical protein